MRVAILGRTKMLLDSVDILLANGHEISLIGTCAEVPGYTVGVKDFEQKAGELSIPFFCNAAINSEPVVELLKDSKSDIGISVNWLTVLNDAPIKAFPMGILNAHAGDLPRYRGNACPNWAILNGEKEVVLSIHFMESSSLDSGPIVLKKRFPIDEKTYIGDIYEWLGKIVPTAFVEAIDGLKNKTITPTPQPKDPQLALRCYPRIPEDGLIDWHKNADSICRLVHASSEPFSGAYTYLDGEKLIIWRARIGAYPCPSLSVPGQVLWRDTHTGEVAVAAGVGVLLLESLELSSMRSSAFSIIKSGRMRLCSYRWQ